MKHQEPNCEMSLMPSRQLQRSKSSDARSERQGNEFPFLNCGLLEGSRDADREVLADWASDVQTRVRSSPKTGDDGDARMGKWRSRGKLRTEGRLNRVTQKAVPGDAVPSTWTTMDGRAMADAIKDELENKRACRFFFQRLSSSFV